MKKALSFLFSTLVVCTAFSIVFLLYLRSQSLPVSKVLQTSQMFDLHGAVIDTSHPGQNRQMISLGDMSPYVIQATLATEDRHFYEHLGFDVKGIARAAIVNIQHMAKVQGAGTITQQLARNLYLNHDRTWSRKVKETFYAVQMELHMTKDEILEEYLNQIYYGHSTYGIQAAAQLFFGKDAKDLTLAESALLAGVPKGPRYFSPYYDEKKAKERQRIVLQTMVETGSITQTVADRAASEQLLYKTLEARKPAAAPYFRDYTRNLAIELLGIGEDEFDEGGYKVYTTLDLNTQKAAEEIVAKQLDGRGDLQAALVAVDPRTGYIKAMVGGKSYAENQFNRAVADSRQPGSSFKPFVYLAALESNKLTAVSRFKSEPTVFTYDSGRQTYKPNNFGNKYFDWIDVRTAIAKSDNTFAVHTLLEAGAENVIATARKFGITSPLQPLPSLALGTFPVSPYEMASAFAVFANQGVRIEPTSIVRIENSAGKVLYQAAPAQEQVADPGYTYVMTSLMESVFEDGGTGSRVAGTIKRPVAGKTGTTNTDAWMVGFTPELSTAVWVGYDKDRNISAVESYLAAPIFAEFTERALEAVPPKLFPIPDEVVSVYIDPKTGKLSNDDCPNSRMEAFVRGTEPTEYCTEKPGKPEKSDPAGKPKDSRSWWDDLKRWWTD
jgi:1A family penicillin-binding protein